MHRAHWQHPDEAHFGTVPPTRATLFPSRSLLGECLTLFNVVQEVREAGCSLKASEKTLNAFNAQLVRFFG